MYKAPIDLRQREFVGVVLPDPNKQENGNLFGNIVGGLFGGLGGSSLNDMFGGLANSILTGTNTGGLNTNPNLSNNPLSDLNLSGFGNVLNPSNLIASSVSMGLSSLSGGSFLNFGGSLLGLTKGTPVLTGLANAFNTISHITEGFGSLNSFSMGYDSSILRDIGILGNFAGKINSIVPNGITSTIINSIGLGLQDLSVYNEINKFVNDIGDGVDSTLQKLFNDGSSYNIGDIFKFNGIDPNGSDISTFKMYGNSTPNEPEGNIKVYVHIPELMYQMEVVKGIWCFNRLSTVNRNSSSTNSGLIGSLSKSVAKYAAGYVSGNGSFSSGLSSLIGSDSNSSQINPITGGTIGGQSGSFDGMLSGEEDKGSGSSGQYVPLHPGTKVFVRFAENDFNSGQIVGLAHEEIDSPSELAPGNYNPSIYNNNPINIKNLVSSAVNLIDSSDKLNKTLSDVNVDLNLISLFSKTIGLSANMMLDLSYDNISFKFFYNSTNIIESDIKQLSEYYNSYEQ